MQKRKKSCSWHLLRWVICIGILAFCHASLINADEGSGGELLYQKLSRIIRSKGDMGVVERLNKESRSLNWQDAEEDAFVGNLRILSPEAAPREDRSGRVYLLRKLTGEVLILSIPDDAAMMVKGAASFYAGLDNMYETKMKFKVKVSRGIVDGENYPFAQFTEKPTQLMLDRVFRISIVLMLFFVMVGMGLTLTIKDFALVFVKPRGIIVGQILQFGVMPLLAFGLGHSLGFYREYPFIFVGMILITAIPGGVTSNLMTYYAKGDLALSISLTSFSTVLSIFFTPFLLTIYCSKMPEVVIPVKVVMQTIFVLVIIPLIIGMSVRTKWSEFAKKSIPFFSALGVLALLALILAGIFGNLYIFADTDRYGVKFYTTVFLLTFLGMMFGIVSSKLVGINNYQTRAISLETGLRNAALSMTIALLIQDAMGDFYSSMLVTSGLFGLVMYIAGIVSIVLYKRLLPLPVSE